MHCIRENKEYRLVNNSLTMNLSEFAHYPQLLEEFRRNLCLYPALILATSLVLLILVSCAVNNDASPRNVVTPTLEESGLITVHYNERPPYLVTTADGVTGLTGNPATVAFEQSNIPFRWQQTPSKRQIYILQQNRSRDCLVGWFKNQEREKFAKYTLPIYQDRPQIALARTDNVKINSVSAVDEIFSDPQLTLLVKDGYSYGDFLDRKITQHNPTRTITTDENSGMLQMVHAGRADYFLIAPEEAAGLIQLSEFPPGDFKVVHFSDIPSGEKRYILCSLQVEDAIISQLNEAIRQYVQDKPPAQ